MAVLSVNGISKNYGPIKALKNVSFDVPEGSVFGILGPNGSGKTTMLGIIMDVLRPTSGSFSLLGQQPSELVRRNIGTLLETPNFYHYLSGKRNLQIAARIKEKGADEIDDILQRVNLFERKDSRFSTYSLGMKQRLAIASCLLGNPDVLVFDEPTNGLDPVGIAQTRALIQNLSKEGKTIIMASHLLDEVEKVCTHVAILQKGTLLTHGHVDEVLVTEDIIEASAEDIDTLEKIANAFQGITRVSRAGNLVELYCPTGEAKLQSFNEFCFAAGVTLSHLRLRKKSLEAKFFELTNNNSK